MLRGKAEKGKRRTFAAGKTRASAARRKPTTALESLMWNTAGATGEAFFRTLVIELATTLQVRAAFAGRVTEFPHIKALACYDGGRVADCATFSPPSTPCTELITKCLPILCPRNARRKYPETQLFQDLHIEAFAGVPILSRSGSPMACS